MRTLRLLGETLLVVALLAAWPSDSLAQARSRVVLIRTPAVSPATSEALTRLEAEMRAAGFDVVVVERAPEPDVRPTLEREAAAAGAFAAIVILPTSGGSAADVWVVDRATNKTVVRTVQARRRPGESAPATLAIRAVELLRASLLEGEAAHAPDRPAATEPPPPLPADVSRWIAPPVSAYAFRLGAGVSMLHSFDGIGPAFAPTLRLAWGVDALVARLSVTGPAVGPSIDVPAGEVAVRQEMAGLEAVFSLPISDTPLVPSAALGGGVHHLTAVAALAPPQRGATDDAWSGFFSTGIGLGVRASDRLTPHLDICAIFTEPRPTVVVGGEPVGRAGRPSLIATLGLIVKL